MSNLSKTVFTSFCCFLALSNAYALSNENKNSSQKPVSSLHQTGVKAPAVTINVKDKINLNQASAKKISKFKGLGPKRSQAIVDFRNANGVFTKLEDLSLVKEISKRFIEKNHNQLKETFIL